jgi:hypothetical protein
VFGPLGVLVYGIFFSLRFFMVTFLVFIRYYTFLRFLHVYGLRIFMLLPNPVFTIYVLRFTVSFCLL